MDIIKITPRGYCYGVVDAMVIARNASSKIKHPRPIYILGMIVHNKHVTDAFEEDGIITLDGPNRLEILENITEGTVVFTAHGVSPQVKARAKEKGLTCIDATCPDVEVTHELIREKTADDYDVIYIGKKGHPEPEGAVGVCPEQGTSRGDRRQETHRYQPDNDESVGRQPSDGPAQTSIPTH